MDQQEQVGPASLHIEIVGGKAQVSLSISASALEGAASASAGLSVSVDASALLDLVFAAIEAKSPAGAIAIEEGVKSALKTAVASL